jgi:hypothetical protein
MINKIAFLLNGGKRGKNDLDWPVPEYWQHSEVPIRLFDRRGS